MTSTNTPELPPKLEALLYLSGEELSYTELSKTLEASRDQVIQTAKDLQADYETRSAGVRLVCGDNAVAIVPADSTAALVSSYTKSRVSGNLSKVELETLTYIAYRGPITQPQIDEVRGVNSSRALRQLLVRGLVEPLDQRGEAGFIGTKYTLTTQALVYLGVSTVAELPEYERWHNAPEFDLQSETQE